MLMRDAVRAVDRIAEAKSMKINRRQRHIAARALQAKARGRTVTRPDLAGWAAEYDAYQTVRRTYPGTLRIY